MPRPPIPPELRFFSKVEFSDHWYSGTRCLDWTAGKSQEGYGRFYVPDYMREHNASYPAHRWLYERWTGPIPEGYDLDHLCRRPGCVNPLHCEPVTPYENTRRAGTWMGVVNEGKDECDLGHPFDEENTYWRPNQGGRMCRICMEMATLRRRADRLGLELGAYLDSCPRPRMKMSPRKVAAIEGLRAELAARS